jgi:hypothetical protein
MIIITKMTLSSYHNNNHNNHNHNNSNNYHPHQYNDKDNKSAVTIIENNKG